MDNYFTVVVKGCNREQAELVMETRLGYAEDLPEYADFAYTVETVSADDAAHVGIYAGDGSLIGTMGMLDEVQMDVDDEDAEFEAMRPAAVAWRFLVENAEYEYNGRRFTATDCAEWWA